MVVCGQYETKRPVLPVFIPPIRFATLLWVSSPFLSGTQRSLWGGAGTVYLLSTTLTFFRLSHIMCMRCNWSKLTYGDILIAHPQSGFLSTWFLVEWEFENVGFWGQGKAGVPGGKPLEARERTNNKLNTHIWRWRRDLNPGHIVGRRVLSPLRPEQEKGPGNDVRNFCF